MTGRRPGGAAKAAPYIVAPYIVAPHFVAPCIVVILLCAGSGNVYAQAPSQAPPPLGWANTADLSLVVTAGNTASQTLGVSDELRYYWPQARFDFDLNVIRSYTSDDRFFQVDPGLEFPVGGAPANPPTSLVTPDPTLDVATYLLRGGYERRISPRLFWNTGASWYRNEDAGILNRYIAYAGVGNNWIDNQRRRFATTYGISYTDREETEPDPDKDRRFAGARFGWDYTERFNRTTAFDSDLDFNVNLSDPGDFSIGTLNALSVAMNSRMAIKASVQWLFEHEPALASDLDVVAFIEVVNPDGLPGTGDERYRTLPSGGITLVLGSSDARKDKLDTIVRTSLVIKF